MDYTIANNLIKYFELCAGIIGLVCYFKQTKSAWKFFSVYLILLFAMEMLGLWLGEHEYYQENTILYKWIVIPSLFIMYHYLYYQFSKKNIRRFIILSALIFILSAIIENLFLQNEHYYTISISISIGCIAVLLFGLIYFFDLLKSNAILTFKSNMPFWFCIAVIIFYIGCFPYLAAFNSMANKKELFQIYRWLFIFLNYIMYILFSFGFIWSKPK